MHPRNADHTAARIRRVWWSGLISPTGEAYESKAGVLKGVEAVQQAAADATIDDKTNA